MKDRSYPLIHLVGRVLIAYLNILLKSMGVITADIALITSGVGIGVIKDLQMV